VYRLETLRVSSQSGSFHSIFQYLEDRAVQKDKAGMSNERCNDDDDDDDDVDDDDDGVDDDDDDTCR